MASTILLFRKGFRQFLKGIFFIFFKLHGNKPLLANHLHLANVQEFTPEGWCSAYHIIQKILSLNPELKGVLRSSWFFDPAMSDISPNLAYLREIPVKYGAEIFYHSDKGRESGSFSRSKRRLKLFEAGEYVPKIYYLVWPKQGVNRFVEKNSNNARDNVG